MSLSVKSFVFVLLLLICLLCTAQQQSFIWNTVKIGGGGGVNGIMQSLDSTIYVRATVGGIYRLNRTSKYWQQLMDFIPASQQNVYGTMSFAVSPTNNNTIYVISGMYEWDIPKGVFMKSLDKGNTWSDYIYPIKDFTVGSNEGFGRTHSRLKVIANDKYNNVDILYYGSQIQGLLISNDSGDTWNIMKSFPFRNSSIYYKNDSIKGSEESAGIIFVDINPFNIKQIFVMLYEYGIYQSNDNGDNWRLLPHSNKLTCYASQFNQKIQDNLLYLACNEGFFIYNISTDKFIDFSPKSGDGYRAIDISLNGEIMIVSTICRSGNEAWDYNQIYYINLNDVYKYKLNWIAIPMNNTLNVLPWCPPGWIAACVWDIICDNIYDDCRRILYGDYFQIWFNDNIFSNNYKTENIWYNQEAGHEEIFVFALSSIPLKDNNDNDDAAILFIGAADTGGFRITDIEQYPVTNYRLISPSFTGYDFCESNTSIIVMVAGGEGINFTGNISYDNGYTFTQFPTAPHSFNNSGFYGGSIYINPSNCNHFVWIPLSNYPYVTIDGGHNWIKSHGAPINISGDINGWLTNSEWINGYPTHFMNDRKNGNYWYIWDAINNHIFVSNDGGFNWNISNTNSPLPGFKGDHTFQDGYLSSDFANEGHLCICLGFNGLYCSNDYGKTFNIIRDIYICRMVTFGVSEENKIKSIMYFFGLTNDDNKNGKDEGMYMVNNNINNSTVTYIKMNNDSYQLGDNPRVMIGDRNIYGLIYVGSNGRGLFYSTLNHKY